MHIIIILCNNLNYNVEMSRKQYFMDILAQLNTILAQKQQW